MKEKFKKKRSIILAAAFDVFGEKGYHATKISDIAKRLDMGHGTFYRYFKNKLDIFTSVMDEIFADIVSVITHEPPTKPDTLEEYTEQFRIISDGLGEVFKKDIKKAKILFYEVLGVDPELNTRFERAMSLLDEYAEAYMVNGVNKGFFRQDIDTATMGKAINSMIFSSVKDSLKSKDPASSRALWTECILNLLIKGISK